MLLDGDQLSLLQDTQVLGDRRLADRNHGEQLADRGGALAQPFDELTPGGICKCFERSYISHSLYKYTLIHQDCQEEVEHIVT